MTAGRLPERFPAFLFACRLVPQKVTRAFLTQSESTKWVDDV